MDDPLFDLSAATLRERLVPANPEAEQAVLGSILIDPDAVIRVAAFLHADDFYQEKNGWIYQAILDLHERREPADFLTLTDELERRRQLDEVGGPAYVMDLINTVPTAIHVEHYARIVERTSVLRKLIRAAGQIAQIAYEETTEDVSQVVDRAEQIVFSVAERRAQRDLVAVRTLMGDVVDRIDYLYHHRGEILGVPTGFKLLDKVLGGLQKSDLLILAARPGMGKTSFSTSLAQSAARKYGKRVAIFSLEMSSEQLVQRMLSAETGIDSQRLRLGDIQGEEEWHKLMEAAGALSEAPIYIDDTPAVSTMELRTKARRLYAEHDLDLIVVDYLQLMQGDRRSENRVQEISNISRSLKGLARELNIPVLALSQLSRAVESRQDKRPILSDLRESGCLAGDSIVVLADTGQPVPIAQLAGQAGFKVWALNETTLKLEASEVSRAFSTGVKPVYRLVTRLGREIRATANHPFRTMAGWKRLDQLHSGEFIALPDEVDRPAASAICWDGIAAIEYAGEQEVFDLTVPVHHNFVANHIIVHNSIEQDADVVMFIYREDMYNEETDRQNVADVIIAKHRNGPTGTVSLFFRKELTQFRDLEVQQKGLEHE
ncbi:MAG: replicative DNA helicase [Caldilineales bacterium]